ncbi:MAG: sugar transferase [Proteobacteria bacterium]|nr:sugar transferase [Pseudomonadota bacterium]
MIAILDFFLAIILLVLISPILILILILIFLQDLQSPIFKQQRVGKNLKIFDIYKFRTMKVYQGDLKSSMTQKDDPRITPIGKILRKTSLDELPQIINILKGEVSFVGPRPYMAWQIEQFNNEEEWIKRHSVKPGITGLAQINGRSTIDQNTRTKLDFEYIDNFSIKFYLKILLSTFYKAINLIKNSN